MLRKNVITYQKQLRAVHSCCGHQLTSMIAMNLRLSPMKLSLLSRGCRMDLWWRRDT